MKNSLQTLNNNTFEVQQNLYFTLSDNKYAIPLKNVVEVMKLPALDYPQKLPNNIIGVLKFNNININILDIRFYLDVNITKYSVDNKFVSLKAGSHKFYAVVYKDSGDGNKLKVRFCCLQKGSGNNQFPFADYTYSDVLADN